MNTQPVTAARSALQPNGATAVTRVDDLEDFFENGGVGLHLVGPDGTILKANRAELELLGYAREEYIGRNIREFHADEDVISQMLACLGRGEKLDKHPARLKAKDGSIKHVLITSSALFEDGKFIHTRGFTLDVTEQRLIEENARRDRELLKAIVETTPECVKIVDHDGRLAHMNSAGLHLVEAADAKEILGKCVLDLIAPEDREAWRTFHERVCRGEKLSWEFGIVGLQGGRRHMETHAVPIAMPDGKRAQLAVTRDITERQKQRQRLMDSERHLRELLEALPAAVYTTDAEGRIDFYNQAAAELAGRRPELGEEWCVTWKLYRPDGTPMPHAECPMAIALREGRPVRGVEAIAERPDGTRVPFMPYPTLLRDSAGQVVGGINMLVDITERKAAEATLRDAHDRLEMVLKTARVGLWEADLLTGTLRVSPTCKANFGLPPDAGFTHETMFAAMHPDDVPIFRAARQKALAGEAPYEVEYRNFWPDGSQHWIFTRASVIRDAAGQPVRLAGLSFDVTDRRRTEAALRASEERLARLLELTPLGIAEIAPSGRILYANAAAERILRLRRSEIEGRRYDSPDWIVTTPDGVPVRLEDTPPARALRGEPVANREVAVVGRDGSRVIISVNAMPLRGHDEKTPAVLVAFTDVTARHQAEQALRESEERFRTMANNIPQLAWMANSDGWIFWYNQRWYDYTGTTPEQMEGWGWQAVHDPEALPQVLARWRKSLATGEAFDMVFPIRGADGLYRPFLTRVAPVRNAAGDVVRWFGTNTDISEQRRIEEALRASEIALQRLNETLEQRVREEVVTREQAQAALFQAQKLEAIGQLTGGVAHDFNNLLTAVIGNLDMLNKHRLNERSQRLVGAALRSAERGAKLIEQLLAYARRQHMRSQPVDLNGLVHGLDDMLRRTLGGLVHVETRLEADLWHALGDPTQLELAILNLAINARDAMPVGGTLTIETGNVRAEAGGALGLGPGEYVRLVVNDTGTGMAPEILQKALDPFFTTKDVGKGSGLGLSQVYGVVTQSGGTIRLQSTPGEGTTVLIWLPRASSQPEQIEHPDHSGARQRGLRGRLLIVDDDAEVRSVALEVLKDAGYHVEEADSGAAALDILENGIPVDLAIVDYAMPRMSGAQFVAAARQRRPNLPVVYLTGYADPAKAAQDPAAIIVKKPYRIPELLRVIEETLVRQPDSSAGANVIPMRVMSSEANGRLP